MARCSVNGSKFWFNCNPEYPQHWFYTEWIKKKEEKNALYIHFTMDDNPSLSNEVKKRYEGLYSGVFYERFVKGRWVAVHGAVYPFMADSEMYCEVPSSGLKATLCRATTERLTRRHSVCGDFAAANGTG